ncbi:MAG: hypothetical protein HY875_10525 [Chloroflexi bacterium]|nr:hypothetical protein [Chloroflexota bacterium]
MTVGELIELLQGLDPEAEVRIMSQEGWPFGCAIVGLAVRESFPGEDCECAHDDTVPEGCAANDVFIVEGEQERYGNKAAWDVCSRY